MDRALWFNDDRYTTRPRRELFSDQREILQNCQLASKALCGAASPCLFRSLKATSSHALHKVLALSETIYASCVHEITVNPPRPVDTTETYLNDLCVILPICSRNLPSLRVLSIARFEGNAEGVPEKARQILFKATQNTFRYGLFHRLEELSLRLPFAYDFEVLAESGFTVEPTTLRRPLYEVLVQLRHLQVFIQDNSGHLGQRYYSSLASESQTHFRNVIHQKGFFGFVELATQLESLSISCTHALDMDLLSIANFKQLHVLVLSRIKVSMENFEALITQNKSTIRALDFSQLELKTGTWENLFTSSCSLPHLKYLHIESCGYIQSSNHAAGLLPPIDDPQDLETSHFGDYDALGDLQRHVMEVRDAAGLAQMTEYDFKWGYQELNTSELSASTD